MTNFVQIQPRTRATLVVLMLLIAWWSAASIVTIELKTLLNGVFDTAFCLTAHTNVLCSMFMWLVLGLRALQTKKFNWFTNDAWRFVVVMGICQGIEYGLINQALHDVTLATRTMIMSSSAMYTFITAQCWGLPPKFTWARCGCMMVLVIGGIFEAWVASDERGGNTTRGVICLICALSCSAQRWAYAQKTFQSFHSPVAEYNKLEIAARLLPFAALPCYFASAAVETVPPITREAIERMLVVSIGLMVLTSCELKLVHLTSSTTFVIFSLIHNIPLFLCGIIFFHDDVAAPQLVGFVVTLIGSLWYSLITDLTGADRGDSEREGLVDGDTSLLPPPSAPPLPDAGSIASVDSIPAPSAPPLPDAPAGW